MNKNFKNIFPLEILLKKSDFDYLNIFSHHKLFYCKKINKFINLHYVCDGNNDCEDFQDEFNCSFSIISDKNVFYCMSDNKKINIKHVCDFFNDCSDKSDEIDCSK